MSVNHLTHSCSDRLLFPRTPYPHFYPSPLPPDNDSKPPRSCLRWVCADLWYYATRFSIFQDDGFNLANIYACACMGRVQNFTTDIPVRYISNTQKDPWLCTVPAWCHTDRLGQNYGPFAIAAEQPSVLKLVNTKHLKDDTPLLYRSQESCRTYSDVCSNW